MFSLRPLRLPERASITLETRFNDEPFWAMRFGRFDLGRRLASREGYSSSKKSGFGLPICREGDAASAQNAERLNLLAHRLSALGAGNLWASRVLHGLNECSKGFGRNDLVPLFQS